MIDRLAWTKKPLSWSAISSFEYDREQWYRKYILGEKTTSREMEFGKMIGKKLETDPTFLPMVPRLSIMEYPFKVKLGEILMVGYADSFCDKTCRKLNEFKTGKKEWDQDRADTHGQVDAYLLMNYLTHKVKPEEVEVTLVWMPTEFNEDFSIKFIEPIEETIRIFKTKRTMTDILKFAARVKRVYNEMVEFSTNHK
jgi:hypothetical protein